MIIAYDLRYACDHFAGIGKHTHALLEALLDLPGDDRYRVLWDPRQRNTRFDLAPLRDHPRVEWVERPWHPIRPFGMLQTGLWLRATRPDVYLSPFGLRPLFSGVPEVLTLHDVSALRMAHIPSLVSRVLYRLSLLDAVRARRSRFIHRDFACLVRKGKRYRKPLVSPRFRAIRRAVVRSSTCTMRTSR